MKKKRKKRKKNKDINLFNFFFPGREKIKLKNGIKIRYRDISFIIYLFILIVFFFKKKQGQTRSDGE